MDEEIGSGVNQGVDVELPRTTAVFGEKVGWNLDDPDVMMANVSENHGTVEENGGEEALRGGEEIGMDCRSVFCRDQGLLRVLDNLRPFTAPLFAWAAAVGRGTARLPWSVSSLLRRTMSTGRGGLVW